MSDRLRSQLYSYPTYARLTDVTDIAGVRIICFFEDDVDAVAQIVQREFEIDTENTIDKRAALEPDRFGYLSLHHVLSLGPDRVVLTEHRRFAGLKAEIQTRSIVQHAWAEIEHDLGYKRASQVPRHIRRRFSRIAGLLELADQEFVAIKTDLGNYEKALPAEIDAAPEKVLIDLASLSAFITNEPRVAELDIAVSNLGARRLVPMVEDIPYTLERLQLAGFRTIAELKTALDRYGRFIVPMTREIFRLHPPQPEGLFPRGISIFLLAYVVVAINPSDDVVREFLRRSGAAFSVEWLRGAAGAVGAI